MRGLTTTSRDPEWQPKKATTINGVQHVSTGALVPLDVHRRLRLVARARRVTMRTLITDALRCYLNGVKPPSVHWLSPDTYVRDGVSRLPCRFRNGELDASADLSIVTCKLCLKKAASAGLLPSRRVESTKQRRIVL